MWEKDKLLSKNNNLNQIWLEIESNMNFILKGYKRADN